MKTNGSRSWAWGWLLAGVLLGCGSEATPTCVPGEARACSGPEGCDGSQVCGSDGAHFEACVCGSGTGGSSGGGSPPEGGSGGLGGGGSGDGGVGTGGATCEAEVGNGDPACEACAQGSCCAELTGFNADPTDLDKYGELASCAQTSCTAGECFYAVCDATFDFNGQPTSVGYYFLNEFVECLTANCCDALKACTADSTCASCVVFSDTAACDTTELDEPYSACALACS